jgi:hypothetical protein
MIIVILRPIVQECFKLTEAELKWPNEGE